MANNLPLEASEQMAFVQYLQARNIKHSSIPNSTYTTSWKQKRHNKDMGLNAGLPDLLLCLPNILLFIEMKRKPNKPSPEQKEWINRLKLYDGVEAHVCYSCDEAISCVKFYEQQ